MVAALAARQRAPEAIIHLVDRAPQPGAAFTLAAGEPFTLLPPEASPQALAPNYPRGGTEFLGLFTHLPSSEVQTLLRRLSLDPPAAPDQPWRVTGTAPGKLAAEAFARALEEANITFHPRRAANDARRQPEGHWKIWFQEGGPLEADRLLLASGGGWGNAGAQIATQAGHTLTRRLPTLAGGRLDTSWGGPLVGVSLPRVRLRLTDKPAQKALPPEAREALGPVHFPGKGLSGDALRTLTSRAAEHLAAARHRYPLEVHWAPHISEGQPTTLMQETARQYPRREIGEEPPAELPSPLWHKLIELARLRPEMTWGSLKGRQLQILAGQIAATRLMVKGHFIDGPERATCGGIPLAEVELRTSQSKLATGLYLAGDLLACDGLPGGYTLLAAFTTGVAAGRAMVT